MDPEEYQDPALRRAIAESLRNDSTSVHQSPSARTEREVVDLTGDSDDDELRPLAVKSVEDVIIEETDDEHDEDLKKAIALSMQNVNSSSPQPQQSEEVDVSQNGPLHFSHNKESSAPNSGTNVFGLLGIDRKKQEEERLARAAKRKAEQSISPPPTRRETKALKPNTADRNVTQSLSAATRDLSSTQRSSSHTGQAVTPKETPAKVTPSSNPSVQFPKGVVKKTWVLGCPRKGDDIKIEEVFQRSDLELAILSAFQWDMEWLFSKLDTARTRFLLVMQAKEESTVSCNKTFSLGGLLLLCLTMVETPIRGRNGANEQPPIVLPADGWTDQLYAFQTDAPLPSQLPEDRGSKRQSGTV
jgi:hypothetical protein